MKKIAAQSKKIAAVAIIYLAAAWAFPNMTMAAAGSPQECAPSSSCKIGEFLYDDEYASVSGASCTITSRYPDGTIYINGEAMTESAEGDGWYYYDFTAASTTGYYRTQVCCTVSGETICVDKSFEVKEATATSSDDIASAVWGYSSRTLSSFGSLIGDIWNHVNRSLTSLNAGDDGVVNISNIAQTTSENRLLLEQLVNKPIVEFSMEEDTIDLGAKADETKAVASQLYVNSQYLTSMSGSLVTKWNSLSSKTLLDSVIKLNGLLGEETDSTNSKTVFGEINWLKNSWGWEETSAVQADAKAAKRLLGQVQTSLGTYSRSSSSLNNMKSLVRVFASLEKQIGTSTDASSQGTLYAKIKETEELARIYDLREEEIDKYLSQWDKNKNSKTVSSTVNDFKRKVIAVNKIPRASAILSAKSDVSGTKLLKNTLLRLKGILQANKKYLANAADTSLASTWLEEGSLVFKTLATNPSTIMSQEVDFKYYLPPEVGEEDIDEADAGLEVKYDTERNQFYVRGKFTLAAGETQSYSVKVQDIWIITKGEVESMKAQAYELSRPLEGTSFFAQGVTLKSDIDASADKILTMQAAAITPEQKIRAYREAMIEKQAVLEKLASLQSLTTQAGSTGTLLGFVGGAQAIAVWGLIIIMTAGFVFLALYMRNISEGKAKKKVKKDSKKPKSKKKKTQKPSLVQIGRMLAPFVIVGLLTSAVTALVFVKASKNKVQEEVLGEKELLDEEESEEELGKGGLDIVLLQVPGGSKVNLRQGPSKDDSVVEKIAESQEVIRIGEIDGWVNIVVGDGVLGEEIIEGWIYADFIFDAAAEEELFEEIDIGFEEEQVTIDSDLTSYLKVRLSPRGEEIARVYAGETYPLIGQEDGWYQIELLGGTLGFIHSDYASIGIGNSFEADLINLTD